MSNLKQNYFNVEFSSMLLKRVLVAINIKQAELSQLEISRYGTHDDFVYSEYLTDEFVGMHQSERFAVMQIIRNLINASSGAYYNLLEDNYLQYEVFNKSNVETMHEIDAFIDRLESESE
jgi:hypothetical protein